MGADPNPLLEEEDVEMTHADRLLADLAAAREIVKTRMARVQEKQKETYDARHRDYSSSQEI